jgi:transposase-like protein
MEDDEEVKVMRKELEKLKKEKRKPDVEQHRFKILKNRIEKLRRRIRKRRMTDKVMEVVAQRSKDGKKYWRMLKELAGWGRASSQTQYLTTKGLSEKEEKS